jgi:hypothetical protein
VIVTAFSTKTRTLPYQLILRSIFMAYDIRFVKLVGGETVIGKYDSESDTLKEVAILQTVPTEQGVQILLLPYGYPFEQDFSGYISFQHVLYQYKSCPKDIEARYLESTSSLTIAGAGTIDSLNNLQGAGVGNIADLLKK